MKKYRDKLLELSKGPGFNREDKLKLQIDAYFLEALAYRVEAKEAWRRGDFNAVKDLTRKYYKAVQRYRIAWFRQYNYYTITS